MQDAVAFCPPSGPFAAKLVAIFNLKSTRDKTSASTQVAKPLVPVREREVAEHLRSIENSLKEGLPSHAVPSAFLPVNRLPQTTSGKLDRMSIRRWLAEMDEVTVDHFNEASTVDGDEDPMTDAESILAKVWAEVLNIAPERIGRSTSFFQLGGDSITAMNVVSRCRALGAILTVKALMQSKTILKTAEHIGSIQSAPDNSPKDTDEPFELSPIQQIYASLGAIGTRFHQSFLLKSNVDTSLQALRQALKAVVEYHPMLHARLVQSEGGWQQQIVPPSDKDICAFAATSRSTNTEAAIEQTQACIDLQNGPVIAACLIKTPDTDYVFLTAHHVSTSVQVFQLWQAGVLTFCLDGNRSSVMEDGNSRFGDPPYWQVASASPFNVIQEMGSVAGAAH